MSQVETVRGPVQVDALGETLMHEHVFVLSEEIRRNYPHLWDEEQRVADAVRRLRSLTERGVRTIVDPTVLGLGRDVERVARINAQVDLNIIVATGLYTYRDVPFFFHFHGPGTMFDRPEPMVDMFVQDITKGIADTGIKAAFLKCAIEEELSPGVERVMKAVSETHKRTGVPITVHTSAPHRTGLVAQEIFRREGVDLSKVVIGHSGDTPDVDYLVELIDNGSLLGMDRFGLDVLLPEDQRVTTVAKLAAAGYADRMVLAQDASCHVDWLPPGLREEAAPNWHFNHIHDDVLPALREAGVSEKQLTTMLVHTPRQYFNSMTTG